jgi:4'-phosphopantetheinyl transferase
MGIESWRRAADETGHGTLGIVRETLEPRIVVLLENSLVHPVAVTSSTAAVLSSTRTPERLLSSEELDRAAGFRFETDRRDFIAAHVLVRLVASRLLRIAPSQLTIRQVCATCGGNHGRPTLVEAPHIAVSLAHSRGHIAAAAGMPPLGIDIETIDPNSASLLEPVGLTPAELATLRSASHDPRLFAGLWVRKEAAVKAGVATLDEISAVSLVRDGRILDRLGGLCLTMYERDHYVAAVCAVPHARVTEFPVGRGNHARS